MNYLLIALGSAAGGIVRYFISTRLPVPFPWATFVVNFAGGLLIGYLANRLDTREQQRIGMAVSYAAASVACCVAGTAATYHGGK